MSATITEDVTETRTTDDAGVAAHIVFLPPEFRELTTPQAYVMEARVEGREIVALCGHRWVPQRDPKPLPVCARCLHLYQTNGSDLDQRGSLPDA